MMKQSIKVLATDLDRTLFPNGKQPYDESMPLLKRLVEKKGLSVVFVTGRNLDQIREGMGTYDPPLPNFAVAEVGTKVYDQVDGEWAEDEGYIAFVKEHTSNWEVADFHAALRDLPSFRLQEAHNQNAFKVSYYVDRPSESQDSLEEARKRVRAVCQDASIIYSVDETIGIGLFDILPKRANKMEGLEFLRERLALEKEEILYCGDSGNDLLPLTFGYRSVLVRNAIEEVRSETRQEATEKGILERVYFAQGMAALNGNYASGIIEAMVHFGLANQREIS